MVLCVRMHTYTNVLCYIACFWDPEALVLQQSDIVLSINTPGIRCDTWED